MHIYELLDLVRKRPGFYVDDEKSIKRLRSFLVGYQCGAYGTKNELEEQDDFFGFNDWVAHRLGYPSSAGWCNIILWNAKSDEKAYALFFDLLDQFKRERNPKLKRLEVLMKDGLEKPSRRAGAKRKRARIK